MAIIPSLRGHAAVALGLLGHNEAEEILLEQLENSSHRAMLLEQTTIGLALMQSDSLHGKLLRMLAPEDGAMPTLSEVTAAARGPRLGRRRAHRTLPTYCDGRRPPHREVARPSQPRRSRLPCRSRHDTVAASLDAGAQPPRRAEQRARLGVWQRGAEPTLSVWPTAQEGAASRLPLFLFSPTPAGAICTYLPRVWPTETPLRSRCTSLSKRCARES